MPLPMPDNASAKYFHSGFWRWQPVFPAHIRHADQINFAAPNDSLLIHQPCAAGRSKTLNDAVEGRLAPVIVIARNAIHRSLDAGQHLESFRQMLCLLNKV